MAITWPLPASSYNDIWGCPVILLASSSYSYCPRLWLRGRLFTQEALHGGRARRFTMQSHFSVHVSPRPCDLIAPTGVRQVVLHHPFRLHPCHTVLSLLVFTTGYYAMPTLIPRLYGRYATQNRMYLREVSISLLASESSSGGRKPKPHADKTWSPTAVAACSGYAPLLVVTESTVAGHEVHGKLDELEENEKDYYSTEYIFHFDACFEVETNFESRL